MGQQIVYDISDMEIGESRIFPFKDIKQKHSIQSSIHYQGISLQRHFVTRVVDAEGGLKVWRVKLGDKIVRKKDATHKHEIPQRESIALVAFDKLMSDVKLFKIAIRAHPELSQKQSLAKEAYEFADAMIEAANL